MVDDQPIADTDPTVDLEPVSRATREPRPTVKIGSSDQELVDLPDLYDVEPSLYVIGPELARGGMGRIRAARDRRLGRYVALKELLPDMPGLVRRFEREARITARLQHPSIVSVLEAGRWPSGLPFYAMKLVEGRSLQAAIHACTTPEQRIAILPNILAVADAMAYAHAQRVIHRDLKPSNVLVGEFGETVVIDWGIAKSIDDPESPVTPIAKAGDIGGQTRIGEVLGTPGYMSPEQAAGQPVDARADVFAIGALLYYTLAGRPAFFGSEAEIEAAMKVGAEPITTVAPTVPADLAAIVERAMASDLSVRYADARELADDLRRFQTGQLVGAHRYSTRQLIARWIRRHRTAVAVAAIAAIAIFAIGTVSLRSVLQSREAADAQRLRALQRGADAEDNMGFMLFSLAEKLRQAGRLELIDTVVRRAVDYYDRVVAADIDPTRLVTALTVVGDVLRDEGDLSGALHQYQRAEQIAQSHASEDSIWRHHLATAYNSIGEATYLQGDLPAAIAYHRKALAIAEALVGAEPDDPRWQRDLAASQRLVGTVLEDQGDTAGAIAFYQASLAIRKRVAEASTDPDVHRDLMVGHTDVGLALVRRGDDAAGMAELEAALALAERAAAADPHGNLWRRDVASAHERIGRVLAQRGDRTGALAQYRQELDVMAKLTEVDSANLDWQRRLSVARELVGLTLLELGDADGALRELRASREIQRDLTGHDATNMRWRRDLSVVTSRIGDALLSRNDFAGALAEYRDALQIRESLVAKDPTNVKWQADIFTARRRIANALARTGDTTSALGEYEAAATLAGDITKRDASAIDDLELVELHDEVADLMIARHDAARARSELELAIAIAVRRAEHAPSDHSRAEALAKLRAKLAGLAK